MKSEIIFYENNLELLMKILKSRMNDNTIKILIKIEIISIYDLYTSIYL